MELRSFSKNVRLVRGKDLCEERIASRITENLEVLTEGMLPPLRPLLKRLQQSFAGFKNQDVLNGISAAEWALEHEMVQQAATLLQETIITWLARKPEVQKEFVQACNIKDGDLSRDCRQFCSQIFTVYGPSNLSEEDWKPPVSEHRKTAEFINKKYLTEELRKAFSELTQIRNDMNHGGYAGNSANPGTLENSLISIMRRVRKFLAATENPEKQGVAAEVKNSLKKGENHDF